MPIAWFLVVLALVSLALALVGQALALRLFARRAPAPDRLPAVSILRPLRGPDDGLDQNLESLARLDYPEYEVLLGCEDPGDPALHAARALQRRHPGLEVTVVAGIRPRGTNPKVGVLEALVARARHPWLLVSDSNVRLRPDDLRRLAGDAAAPGIGLVHCLVVGVGERTLGARLENLHLNGFLLQAMAWATLWPHSAAQGKGMLLSREALAAAGGLAGLRDFLHEDHLLARRIQAAGLGVRPASVPARTVNESWGVDRFLDRHLRWGRIRIRVSRAAYLAEPLLNPVPWAAAAAVAAGLDGVPGAGPVAAAALVVAARCGADAAFARLLRGPGGGLRAADLPWIPVKDLLVFGMWLAGAVGRTVRWRGRSFLLGRRGELSPAPVRPASRPQGAAPSRVPSRPQEDAPSRVTSRPQGDAPSRRVSPHPEASSPRIRRAKIHRT